MPIIETSIEYRPVIEALRRAAGEMRNTVALMKSVAGTMLNSVEENFAQEGRPKWVDLHPGTKLGLATTNTKQGLVMRKGGLQGKILQRSGGLAGSISQRWSASEAVVGSNKVYAAIHQFGGRTKPHVIRARNKRALSFGGIVVRQVNHPGSNIPARPFLRLTPRDLRDIVEDAQAFHARAIARNQARGP
ncbi:MAG: phage virion morphogenesis protein [Rubrivivax sp.]|jgi:phage virion morphogenesis protein|nr:phage virion morphogenesis protein [Rubrivivax sp.]